MAEVRVPEFNSANVESNIQMDSPNSALKVYTGGAWQTHQFGGALNSRSAGLLGTTSPLLAESVPLFAANANTTALTTAVMTSVAIYLPKGLLVTSIGHLYGTTGGSPAHIWAALYSTAATPALIGQSTDITNETGVAYTITKHTLATPYRVPTAGVYYASLMATTTVPTLTTTTAAANLGMNTGSAFQTGGYDFCVTSGSGLTDTAPATIATTTVKTTIPWVGIF